MMEWQPIETCPENEVIIASDGWTISSCVKRGAEYEFASQWSKGDDRRPQYLNAGFYNAIGWIPLPPQPMPTKYLGDK